MGREVAHQLASKGASIAITARDHSVLLEAISYISSAALHPSQRFIQISADLTSASECIRVIDEVMAWNNGKAPDTVWCCAGTSYPKLFVETPVETIKSQMDSNYMTSAYMAHAVLSRWLKSEEGRRGNGEASGGRPDARHLIFTASFVAFYSFAGYGPYSPPKAALRSLSDTLSQEMNLYAASNPNEPPVRVHTVFPATILTEAYENENKIKHGLTKQFEEDDAGQTPEVVAAKSIRALEGGQEIITTDFLTALVKNSMLGGSVRGGFGTAILNWFMAGVMGLVMIFVRGDHDRKARAWGRKFGVSEMKREN